MSRESVLEIVVGLLLCFIVITTKKIVINIEINKNIKNLEQYEPIESSPKVYPNEPSDSTYSHPREYNQGNI